MSEETIEEPRAQVADLRLQLREAQDAIQAADEELKRVSGECERVSAEAHGVHDLVSSLRDFMGSGPGSLSTFFASFMDARGFKQRDMLSLYKLTTCNFSSVMSSVYLYI